MVLVLPLAAADAAEPYPLLEEERHRWEACVAGPPRFDLPPDPPRRIGPDIATTIDADRSEYDARSGLITLQGNVVLERADQRLQADEMRYFEDDNLAEASGRVRLGQQGLLVGASGGQLDMARDQSALQDVEYVIPETLTQGTARRVRTEGATLIFLRNATYSTCEPGNELWHMRVSRMRLDRESGRGEAWHARLALWGVPVAYTPYANFPIDDRRKTGLLTPTISQSERTGTDLSLPFYWNIAPNYDATLIPRYMSRRGLMLGTEFRYLQNWQSGELRMTGLHDDDVFGDDRWSLSWDQRMRLWAGIRADAMVNRVSDDEYFRDFGTTLTDSSTTHLRSRGRLMYNTPDTSSRLVAEGFQTINPNIAPRNRPYERLPQLLFIYQPQRFGLGAINVQTGLHTEAVRFDHPEPGLRDTGTRLDMTPRISVPYERPAGYIRPSLAMRLTSYDLDRGEPNIDQPDTITRAVPIASLDTGLFFDRNFDAFNRGLRQTLEPRLFYLYVPRRDQDDIPLFDTGRTDQSLFRYFTENRFTGADRVGDANQVTAGLTSRFLNRADGREYFRASIGQIYYFADREITLRPGQEPETRNRSDIIGELQARLPAGFLARGEIHWDPDAEQTTLTGARLSWQPERRRTLLTAGYRTRREEGDLELHQGDIALIQPLGAHWLAMTGWRYDFNEDRTLEAFGGLEYRDCCWSIRLLNRYFREDAMDEPERAIMLQFEFRGLGDIGDDVDRFLEDAVFGYRDVR